MKKFLKITGVIVLLLILLLALIPLLFQEKIEESLKNSINESVEAKVDWDKLDLSLLSGFPNASINLKELSIITYKPFEGDTLLYAKNLELQLGLFQIFTPDDISIDEIIIEKSLINIKYNKDGIANFDIAKENTDGTSSGNAKTEEGSFSLKLDHYELKDSKIIYQDAENIQLVLDKLNHEGSGDFSENLFILGTHTDSKVSFTYDKINYLKDNNILLDADIEMNMEDMRFTFKENEALINQLPLSFDGFVKINDINQEVNIHFTTPNSDFKNLLALIPENYSGDLEGIETDGVFELDGKLFGIIDDKHIPKIDITLKSKKARFKYKDLPKTIDNIDLDVTVFNKTGLVEDTEVNINTLKFTIDKDQFQGAAHLKNLLQNMKADIVAKGIVNLTSLSQAYPIDTELDLNGVLYADFETYFDMKSIKKERYQNIKSKGKIDLSDFKYTSSDLANPFEIKTASVIFNSSSATLNNFEMKTGQTDLKASGRLDNLIAYVFSDKDLKGRFTASSNRFNVNDFMTESQEEKKKEDTNNESQNKDANQQHEEAIKLPKGLDVALDFNAKEVIYDKYTLKNTQGLMSLKDQTAQLNNVNADLFGGKVYLDGKVSTQKETPNFGMKFKLQDIDIVESIAQVELLKSFTPILKSLVGKISTDFNLNGNMTNGLSPILTSLNGNGLANIIKAKIEPSKMPLTNALNSKLNLIDFSNFDLENITTKFSFENGNINVKPLSFDVDDIGVDLKGQHSLNNEMNYNVNLKLPAKYLGNEVGNQLAKLSNSSLDNMKIDLPIVLKGSLTKPNINIDMKSAVNNLKNQIIEDQKNKIIDKAGDTLNDLLGGEKSKEENNDKGDVKETVKNVLGGLLGGKKKE